MRPRSMRLLIVSAGVLSGLIAMGSALGGCDETIPAEPVLVESESVQRFLSQRQDGVVIQAVRHAGQAPRSESRSATGTGAEAASDSGLPSGEPVSGRPADAGAASLAAAEVQADTLGVALRSIVSAGGASDATLHSLILGPSQCGAAGRSLVRWQKADAHRLIDADRAADARRRAVGLIDTATTFVHASWAAARLPSPVDPLATSPADDAGHQLKSDRLAVARVQAMNAQTAFRIAAETIRELDDADPGFLTSETLSELDTALGALAEQAAALGPVIGSAGTFARNTLERFGPSVEALRRELAERASRG